MADHSHQTLQVRIASSKQVFYEGEALSISSKNSKGPFDILPYHANFITLIENAPIQIQKTDRQIVSFTFSVAILYSRENRVDVYTDIQVAQ